MLPAIQIALPQPSCFTFFENESLVYYFQKIRYITRLKEVNLEDCEDDFFYIGCNFEKEPNSTCVVFTVCLTNGLDIQFGFLSYEEGRAARQKLISKLRTWN